ncbi:MAG: hypothetical protein AB1758_12290 [Candidatus Eremiobacterota bacterium]
MTYLFAFLGLLACAGTCYGLFSWSERRQASAWTVWLLGLTGASAGVGLAVVVAGLAILFLPYQGDPRQYLFLLLILCFGMILVPVGVLGGVVYHFRRLPRG